MEILRKEDNFIIVEFFDDNEFIKNQKFKYWSCYDSDKFEHWLGNKCITCGKDEGLLLYLTCCWGYYTTEERIFCDNIDCVHEFHKNCENPEDIDDILYEREQLIKIYTNNRDKIYKRIKKSDL